jgi:hypothetical protein
MSDLVSVKRTELDVLERDYIEALRRLDWIEARALSRAYLRLPPLAIPPKVVIRERREPLDIPTEQTPS